MFVAQLPGDRRQQYDRQVDFIQQGTNFNRQAAAELWSGYSTEQYNKFDEAMTYVADSYPGESPADHWSRVRRMIGNADPGGVNIDIDLDTGINMGASPGTSHSRFPGPSN